MTRVYYVHAEKLRQYCQNALVKIGIPDEDAYIIADSLVHADLRGIDSHGVARLPAYIARFRTIPWRPLKVLKDIYATVLIDAGDGPGQPATVKGMHLAIDKAKKFGAGVVGIRASNHFGAAGYFAAIAAEKNMVGIVTSNAPARLAPWGGTTPLLGNNPWSIAVPSNKDYPIILDISNSVVAAGKIRIALEKGEKIPVGWAMDAEGRPTADPQKALDGVLLPIAGHKGYGITLMLEILTGILVDSGFSTGVGAIDDADRAQNMAHLLIVIDIERFATLERFKENVGRLIGTLKASKHAEGVEEIFMPGERSYRKMQERLRSGIPLLSSVVEKIEALETDFPLEKERGYERGSSQL
ncbi:MAG: Ldh family oxidoreductase [Dethiobacteria bacterium]|jgi:LDH2 family malate/lactate/ureidoglycolate dehydrogenase